MSIQWGTTRSGVKVGVEWVWWGDLEPGQSTLHLTANIWLASAWGMWDGANWSNWSGYVNGSGTGDIDVGSANSYWSGEKIVRTVAADVSLNYSSETQYWLTYTAHNIEAAGGDVTVTDWVWVPKRPSQLPRPPKNLAVVKNADTQHTITWQTDFTDDAGGYPWKNVYLDRWDNVSGGWYLIATLGYGTTSYTDNTTIADRAYQYRVRSRNDSGYSSWATSEKSYTTPKAHTNLAWTKTTSDVVLTWTRAASMPANTIVQESANGGAWTQVAVVIAGTNTWTHTSPNPAVTHQYRVAPEQYGIMGAWATSTVVQFLVAPLTPTSLTPTGTTVDPADVVVATWTHQPVDGTAQTAYEHRVKKVGGTYVSSGTVSSPISSRILSGLVAGKTYIHQVRTKGQHADWSPWSAEQSFATGTKPQASVSYPDDEPHIMSGLVVQWTYYDADSNTHVASRVQLIKGTDLVHTATLGAVTEYALPLPLVDLSTYFVRVQVQDSSGLWSGWAEQMFTTAFIPPTTPVVAAEFQPDLGVVLLSISHPLPDGVTTIDAVSNTVYRIVNGVEELVAVGVDQATVLTDYAPITSGTNTYRVVAWSDTPTAAETTITVDCYSPWCFVSGGPNYSQIARLKGGASVSSAVGRTKVLHQFVGTTTPVEFIGPSRSAVYSLSGSVDGFGAEADAWGSWQAWEAIADLPAPLLYRDPLGRREWVSISAVQVQHEVTSKKAKVSAQLTVVDHA